MEGIKQLRVVMPWLGLPVIISSYPPLNRRKLFILLQVFILGVVFHTILSYLSYLGLPLWEVENYRELNLFINTHRFALTIVLAIFFLTYIIKETNYNANKFTYLAYVLILIWLVYFLLFSKILTGILVFLITAAGYAVFLVLSSKNLFLRLGSLMAGLLLLGFAIHHVSKIYDDFWGVPEIERTELPAKTVNGNFYTHDLHSQELINGHYLNLYICEEELRKEWNERSEIRYGKKIGYYGKISDVLKRYLTSKGLTKDSVGISKLDQSDIETVENRIINYKFRSFDFTDRLYLIAKEIYNYQNNNKPQGPFTARLYSIDQAVEIIKENPVIGHGTHTLNIAFDRYYEKNNLTGEYYVASHNQYLRYLIEFGIIGLVWFLGSIFYPYLKIRGYKVFLLNGMFAYYLLASTMNNTFSAQLALTIWVTFYSVFFVYFNQSDYSIGHQDKSFG
jgi:hypothetical protein